MRPHWFYSKGMFLLCGIVMTWCVIVFLATVFIAMSTGVEIFGRIAGMCLIGMIPSGLALWLIEMGIDE